MALKPVLQSLVLADHIYVDAKTGKKVIAGTFNHIGSAEFPVAFHRPVFAYIALTDIHHQAELEIRYVDLDQGETLLAMSGMVVDSRDPLMTVEVVCELPPLPLPHPGPFSFEVHSAGDMLGSLRLLVARAEVDSGHDPDRNEDTDSAD